MLFEDPKFPPLLTPLAVSPPVAAFEHACRLAATQEIGAGDIVWSRANDRAEIALILEPEIALAPSLQMGPLAMVALADCLGVLMPPKTAITLRWPDTIAINGGAAGQLRLASSTANLDETPDWLAIGILLRLELPVGGGEPGDRPEQTTVHAEGGGELTRSLVLQSYAAHVLAWLDVWSHEGFEPVSDRWTALAENGATLDDSAGMIARTPDAAPPTALSDAIDLLAWRGEQVA
ncbi:MAG: biotin/lipoate--protein ligase family protein [Hyphomicrobiaceae bacterium]|nr:biotin/lipoate--protein ligase family protein [Hyphomicrobiaceae bacterium]